MRSDTVVAILEKLGVARPAPDLAGLRSAYSAWCRAVPFDNVLKLTHLADGRTGPLPGSTAESFFETWLEHGTGGTCWAGNAALHDLLEALGFDVTRAIATMLSSPESRGPNHGTVIVTVEGAQWIADASILSGKPIRIPAADEPRAAGPLPRFQWFDSSPAVVWQTPTAPDGVPCRIDKIGAEAGEWDALHQQTGNWSPFNYQLNARDHARRDEHRHLLGTAVRARRERLDVDMEARPQRARPLPGRGDRHLRGDRRTGPRRPRPVPPRAEAH